MNQARPYLTPNGKRLYDKKKALEDRMEMRIFMGIDPDPDDLPEPVLISVTETDFPDMTPLLPGTARKKVFLFIRDAGKDGATDVEIAKALNVVRPSVSRRRQEFVAVGVVKSCNTRRQGISGKMSTVWIHHAVNPGITQQDVDFFMQGVTRVLKASTAL